MVSAWEARMSYIVREFKKGDPHEAALLAEMWNASDAGWPGGWTRGIPDTAERVLERKEREDLLAMFVAEHDGQIVGYGDLNAQAGQQDVAYVPLLNVRPDHHGRSVGRRIVLRILERAIELGYKQLTIGTWPGNTKSVPLYKKTGFFWVPETNAWLQNYIPTILSLPIASGFFARHDWYQCFKRELAQAPDEVEWHGIKVFSYHFEADGEILKVTIDRQSESVTAVETNDLAVACIVGQEDVPAGLTHPVRWEIENKRGDDEPMQVTLIATGEEGIALDVLESFNVTDAVTIEKPFSAATDVEPTEPGSPARKIRSVLLVDGQPVTLGAAVHAIQPIAIEYDGQRLIPGKANERMLVRLRNHLDCPVKGMLRIDPHPALKAVRLSADFDVDAKSWSSCEFWVETDGVDPFQTKLRVNGTAKREGGDVDIATKPKTVAFRPIEFGRVATSVDEEDKRVRLESDSLSVEVHLRGGWMGVEDEGAFYCRQNMPELGPPFVDWRHRPPTLAYRLVERHGRASVTLIAPSEEFPGMVVEKTITVSASPAIRIDQRVINTTASPQRYKLRLHREGGPNESITLPTKNGLLHQVIGGWGIFPTSEEDISKRPEDYTETWSAAEGSGRVVGMVWGDCEENEFERGLPRLLFDLPEVPAQSHVDLEPVYIIAGRGDWQLVRQCWQRLHQPGSVREDRRPVARPVLDAEFEHKPLLVMQNVTSTTACVTNNRGRKLEARLTVEGVDCDATSFDITDVNHQRPFVRDVEVRCADLTPRVEEGAFCVETDVKTERFSAPVVVLGNGGPVRCNEESQGVFLIDNGLCALRCAPGFFGSVIGLERDGVNHLLSAYPDSRAFVWISPWFGGIHPYVEWFGATRMAKEKFSGEMISRRGRRGIEWHGLRTVCDFQHKDFRWLRLEAEYLTVGGSNVIALVVRARNKTAAPMDLGTGIMTWLQPGGSAEDAVLHHDRFQPLYEQGGTTSDRTRQHERRGRGTGMPHINCDQWAAVENPKTGDTTALIGSRQGGRIEALDFDRDGVHCSSAVSFDLEPEETKEALTWLVLCSSVEQARGYRTLGEVWELP